MNCDGERRRRRRRRRRRLFGDRQERTDRVCISGGIRRRPRRRSFPSRQLPAVRCISGSQLTIIGSYRGVAWPRKIATRGVIRLFRTFRRGRKRGDGSAIDAHANARLCPTCANKVTSCRHRLSFGPHTHRDRFREIGRESTRISSNRGDFVLRAEVQSALTRT